MVHTQSLWNFPLPIFFLYTQSNLKFLSCFAALLCIFHEIQLPLKHTNISVEQKPETHYSQILIGTKSTTPILAFIMQPKFNWSNFNTTPTTPFEILFANRKKKQPVSYRSRRIRNQFFSAKLHQVIFGLNATKFGLNARFILSLANRKILKGRKLKLYFLLFRGGNSFLS